MTTTLEFRAITISDVTHDDANGTFSGYAARHQVIDSYGTRFARGSWVAGGLDAKIYALLDMHDPTRRIGWFTAIEDDIGLLIAGGYSDTQAGQEARAQAKDGSANELSVGFVRIATAEDDETLITAARLVEVSQITARMASQPGAMLTDVRDTRLKARCVSCKRFVSKPLCDKCLEKGRSMDVELERRMMTMVDGSHEQTIYLVGQALGRWFSASGHPETQWFELLATFPDSVLVVIYDYAGYASQTTYRMAYAITDGVVSLGTPQETTLSTTALMADVDLDLRRKLGLARLTL